VLSWLGTFGLLAIFLRLWLNEINVNSVCVARRDLFDEMRKPQMLTDFFLWFDLLSN